MSDVPEECERAARVATNAGRHAEAVEALRGLANLTAHDRGPLPCLCRRCLDPLVVECEADGQRFRREFSVVGKRVLYFWLPVELLDDARVVQRSVGAAMRARPGRRRRSR